MRFVYIFILVSVCKVYLLYVFVIHSGVRVYTHVCGFPVNWKTLTGHVWLYNSENIPEVTIWLFSHLAKLFVQKGADIYFYRTQHCHFFFNVLAINLLLLQVQMQSNMLKSRCSAASATETRSI